MKFIQLVDIVISQKFVLYSKKVILVNFITAWKFFMAKNAYFMHFFLSLGVCRESISRPHVNFPFSSLLVRINTIHFSCIWISKLYYSLLKIIGYFNRSEFIGLIIIILFSLPNFLCGDVEIMKTSHIFQYQSWSPAAHTTTRSSLWGPPPLFGANDNVTCHGSWTPQFKNIWNWTLLLGFKINPALNHILKLRLRWRRYLFTTTTTTSISWSGRTFSKLLCNIGIKI